VIDEKQQAITDLVNFIAEFELWLEGIIQQEKSNEWNIKLGYDAIIVETLEDVLENYRRCKERIEKDDN